MSVYEDLDEQKQFACRVIADHARATTFAIADGILPGNEGRNYVLRKIMRRAIYHGREHLGFNDLFFYKVCDFVIDQMKSAYPELEAQRDFIGKMVRLEEERFGNTLTTGLKKLNELIQSRKIDDNIYIHELAPIKDTYGLPTDLMFVVLEQSKRDIVDFFQQGAVQNLIEDQEDFNKKLESAIQTLQQQSNVGKTKQSEKINPLYVGLQRTSVRSEFRGYEVTTVEMAKVVAIIKNDERVEALNEGDEGLIVLNETPFYAESGGQVGDVGILVRTASGSGRLNNKNSLANDNTQPSATADDSDLMAKVFDTFAPLGGIVLHKSKIERGTVKVGDTVTAIVDAEKRDSTRRNHTATHLVHAALREVLGTHVKQAGSVVAPNFLRFDFTHYQALTPEEITEIEMLVNREILKNDAINTDLMAIEEAMQTGAMALFGEKYGSTVRVLRIGEGAFSKELCGGTHVRATGDIGSFKIISEENIASGVRRIRAITGLDAFRRFREDENLIEKSLGALRTQRDQLPTAIEKLQEELKRAKREVEDLKMKIATGAVSNSDNGDESKEIAGVKVLVKIIEGLDQGAMRNLSDTLLGKMKFGVVVLGKKEDGKVSLIVRSSDDIKARVSAGQVIKEIAPIVGGRGGGKPDMAEGGGNQPEKLEEALDASYGVIEKMLSQM